MHRFARDVLTQSELRSGLIFAAATLVVWPVIPNGYFGPFAAVNPRSIWAVVILIMAISACGYIAVRALGSRYGLPMSGFASGFVSSSATIAAMGARTVAEPRCSARRRGSGVVDRGNRGSDLYRGCGNEPCNRSGTCGTADLCWDGSGSLWALFAFRLADAPTDGPSPPVRHSVSSRR